MCTMILTKKFCLQKGKVMGGATRGPEMLLEDDGWGWLMFGLGKWSRGWML